MRNSQLEEKSGIIDIRGGWLGLRLVRNGREEGTRPLCPIDDARLHSLPTRFHGGRRDKGGCVGE